MRILNQEGEKGGYRSSCLHRFSILNGIELLHHLRQAPYPETGHQHQPEEIQRIGAQKGGAIGIDGMKRFPPQRTRLPYGGIGKTSSVPRPAPYRCLGQNCSSHWPCSRPAPDRGRSVPPCPPCTTQRESPRWTQTGRPGPGIPMRNRASERRRSPQPTEFFSPRLLYRAIKNSGMVETPSRRV